MVMSMSDLPEDVVREILLRVSAKLLLRCKSVCKAWKSIISNPNFVTYHLQHAIINSERMPTVLIFQYRPSILASYSDPKIFLERQLQQTQSRLEALLGNSSHDLSSCPISFDSLLIPHLFKSCAPIVGSCNGIICAASFEFMYLWNPAIRQYRRLPDTTAHTNGWPYIMMGFGYDSISADYKILKIVPDNNSTDMVQIGQLYSANSDCWRELKVPILEKWRILQQSNTVVNGVLYFENNNSLISFDLHKEVFGLVPFPDSIKCSMSEVLDFEGSVAMVFESQSGHGIDLWTLDDVPDQDVSWSKKFSIEVDPRLCIWIHSYLGTGLFYISRVFDQQTLPYNFLYDYHKKEITYYGPVEWNTWALSTHKYTETLVSLNGFEHLYIS